MQRKIFAAALFALFASSAYAQTNLNPVTPLVGGVAVSGGNPLPISGSFSATLSGFTPGGTFATLTATNASGSVALPVGTTVAFQNTGTTTVSCTLGIGSATAAASQIQVPASSTVFVTPGTNTFGACIDQTGSVSNLIVLAGGTGLGTGFGGGGGGSGGGGAITAAIGSYAAGALSAGAFATGAGVDGWDLTQGAKADVAWASGSGSVIALLKAIATAEIATNRAVNVAQINGVAPLMGNGVTGTGSQRVTVASDNTPFAVKIDQTTPGTTNLVSIGTNGTVNPQTAASWGLGATAAAVPATAHYMAINTGGNLVGWTGAVTNAGTFVTQSNGFTSWAGGTLGAMANYGTSPGAVLVPGANVFVTNTNANGQATAANSSPVVLPVAQVTADPCSLGAKTNLPISQNGTASVQLVALSGATSIYVCSLSLIAAGATTVALTTGTGSACVTGNAAVIGTTTASIANSMSLAANGGLTLGNGAGTIAKGAASSELCMVLGTSVFVSGNLTYVQL